ncbi:uncharacterized protein LOC143911622 [Arctopsyche grandis]|uniref:uncharacterized protein LOC143911622 n=1 Tax=Arctopsyche grandis TaxID=121162 RepID=UPI00406D79E5
MSQVVMLFNASIRMLRNRHIYNNLPIFNIGSIKHNYHPGCNRKFSLNITKTPDTDSLLGVKTQYLIDKRYKQKKSKHNYDDDDDDDEDDDEYDISKWNNDKSLSRDSKVVTLNLTSMRIDTVVKSALKISRKKIEVIFYESRFRKNGKKVLKKSTPVRPGDEIDIVKSVSPDNPKHIYISRVEILNAVAKSESISITARAFKTLLVENYDEAWTEIPKEA